MNKEVRRQLRWAVEKQHGCRAIAVSDARVHLKEGNVTLWYGTVTVFELEGHPTAKRAYGWYYEIPFSNERRFLSAVHAGPIAGPEDAVRAELKTMNR